ncbi:MAG: glycosyltransferase family 4 protein [Chloroflexi bacterium]|nr:glycosyltransferase family 4 protein [Chloroflexota bacterium]
MTRIGIDARLLAYRKGGIAEYTRQLENALASLDRDTSYAIIHRFRDRHSHCPAPNFRRLNAYTPAHHRWERTALSLELLPRRLDLLHSPDFIPPRRGARRHVITIHDLHFLDYPQFQTPDARRYYADQIHWAVDHADHIFAQTEGTRHDIVERLGVPEEKITVHLLGINPAFRPTLTDILAAYDVPADYLLFVGTIEPRKNLVGLLQAYAQLYRRRPDLPPLVLGGQRGWNADESLAAIDELRLQTQVVWFEDVPFDILPALYSGATLLVLPSFHEGFGLPAIEAMACGTPVIVAERGSLPEVVGDHGIYIDPEDIESIADAIQQLLDDAVLREQMRVRGLQHAATFSWYRTAEIALDVYRRVLAT